MFYSRRANWSSVRFGYSTRLSWMTELTDAKRRIVDRLKRVEHATAPELAEVFELTDTAVRQHLDALEIAGLVERTRGAAPGRGRPPVWWRLAPDATGLFPDRHGDLTVELIRSIREALGDEALDRIVATRSRHQLDSYRGQLPGTGSPVSVRVRRLAELRTDEGYLAEVVPDGDDFVLIEHHCPICDAARTCQGLCSSELELFQAALGDDVSVRREQHLLGGDSRCAYRISTV